MTPGAQRGFFMIQSHRGRPPPRWRRETFSSLKKHFKKKTHIFGLDISEAYNKKIKHRQCEKLLSAFSYITDTWLFLGVIFVSLHSHVVVIIKTDRVISSVGFSHRPIAQTRGAWVSHALQSSAPWRHRAASGRDSGADNASGKLSATIKFTQSRAAVPIKII